MSLFISRKIGHLQPRVGFKYQVTVRSFLRCFFLQAVGGWGGDGKMRGKKKNGRLLLGQTWDAMPAVIFETALCQG